VLTSATEPARHRPRHARTAVAESCRLRRTAAEPNRCSASSRGLPRQRDRRPDRGPGSLRSIAQGPDPTHGFLATSWSSASDGSDVVRSATIGTPAGAPATDSIVLGALRHFHSDLHKGVVIELDGDLWQILDYTTSRSGELAQVRIKLRNVKARQTSSAPIKPATGGRASSWITGRSSSCTRTATTSTSWNRELRAVQRVRRAAR